MSKDVKQTKGLTRLHGLTAAEVSLVPTGANKRRFLILKNGKKSAEAVVGLAQRIRERVLKADPAVMSKVRDLIQRHREGQTGTVNAFGMQDGKDSASGTPGVDHENAETLTLREGNGTEGAGEAVTGHVQKESDDRPRGRGHGGGVRGDVEKDGGLNDMPEDGAIGSGATGGGLSKQAEAALTAVVRILTPFKQEIPSDLLNDVLEVSGFQAPPNAEPGTTHAGTGKPPGEHYESMEKAFQALPAEVESEEDDFLEGVTKGHMMEAAEAAEGHYKEHLEKLGYQKYPVAKMCMKRGGGAADQQGGETVSKSGSATTQPGLAEIKDPHTRRVLEQVQKSNLELVKKNADLEKSLAEQKAAERKKEIVVKASSFRRLGVPQDDLVAQLLDADKLGNESYERVVKNLTAMNAQAEAGSLFSEFGTTTGGSGGADDYDAKLWVLADGIVQKSSGALTREQAYEKAALSPEGQRLYAQYKEKRPHGI